MNESIYDCEGIEINHRIKHILKQQIEICEKCNSFRYSHKKEWTPVGINDDTLINAIIEKVEKKIYFATNKQLVAYIKRKLGHSLNGVDRTHLSRLNNKILQIEKQHSLLTFFATT